MRRKKEVSRLVGCSFNVLRACKSSDVENGYKRNRKGDPRRYSVVRLERTQEEDGK